MSSSIVIVAIAIVSAVSAIVAIVSTAAASMFVVLRPERALAVGSVRDSLTNALS